MKLRPRSLINALLRPTPYRIYRKRGPEVLRDAFTDQAALVGAEKARVVLDVGAHEGVVAQQYLDLLPHATVHAFEPFPPVFEKLSARAAAEPRLVPHHCAVAEEAGEAVLHCNAFEATNSLLPSHADASDHWGEELLRETDTVTVRTRTLDEFCEAQDIQQADVLKLDVQGAELRALRGAEGLLGDGRIALIYVELITVPTYEQQSLYHEVMAYLDGLGYALYNLYNPSYRKGLVLQYDGVFISPTLRDGLKLRRPDAR